MAKCLEMLRTTVWEHSVIRDPLALCYIPGTGGGEHPSNFTANGMIEWEACRQMVCKWSWQFTLHHPFLFASNHPQLLSQPPVTALEATVEASPFSLLCPRASLGQGLLAS